MGLQEILDEINKDSEAVNNDILNQAKMQADKVLVDKMEELNAYYAKQKNTLESDLKRLTSKLMAKAELDAYREKQKIEVELIDNLLNESCHELFQFLKNNPEKYKGFLIKLISNTINIIGVDNIGISLNKEDESFFNEINKAFNQKLSLLPPVKIMGGVIGIAGDSYIDNSLENIFNKLKPGFIKMISESMSVTGS